MDGWGTRCAGIEQGRRVVAIAFAKVVAQLEVADALAIFKPHAARAGGADFEQGGGHALQAALAPVAVNGAHLHAPQSIRSRRPNVTAAMFAMPRYCIALTVDASPPSSSSTLALSSDSEPKKHPLRT